MPKTFTALTTYYLGVSPAAAMALARVDSDRRKGGSGIELNFPQLEEFLKACDRSLFVERLIYFPQPSRSNYMVMTWNELVSMCKPFGYDFEPVYKHLSSTPEENRLVVATHDDRYLSAIIGGSQFESYLKIEIYRHELELSDGSNNRKIEPETKVEPVSIPSVDLSSLSEASMAIEKTARSMTMAIAELIPPMLALLDEVRLDLCFELEELEFLAGAMKIYIQQQPDTSFGTSYYLIAMLDCVDWVRWNNTETGKLRQKLNLLLTRESRENDLAILALLDGLRTALRLTEQEMDEHPYFLELDQAICEVFGLNQ